MTGLEEAFYIVGLIFMGLMLLILLGLLAAVIVIRKKITDIQDTIHSKIEAVSNITSQGAELVKTVTGVVKKKTS